MIQKVFTVYDNKAEAYLPPFYFNTIGEALRSLADTVNDPNSMLHRHPADYTIFDIGTFDNATGRITHNETHTSLGCAIEFKTIVSPTPDLFPVEEKESRHG